MNTTNQPRPPELPRNSTSTARLLRIATLNGMLALPLSRTARHDYEQELNRLLKESEKAR